MGRKKRKANLAKHGIDFADLEPLFAFNNNSIMDGRYGHG